MNRSDRAKLCKLQQSGGKSLYILYSSEIKPFSQTQTVHGPTYPKLMDCAGIFDTKKDAQQAVKCLNNIFSKIDDKYWDLNRGGYGITQYVQKSDGAYKQYFEGDDSDYENNGYRLLTVVFFISKCLDLLIFIV